MKQSQSGFSLIELVVTITIASGLSLLFAELIHNQFRLISENSTDSAMKSMTTELRNKLRTEPSCRDLLGLSKRKIKIKRKTNKLKVSVDLNKGDLEVLGKLGTPDLYFKDIDRVLEGSSEDIWRATLISEITPNSKSSHKSRFPKGDSFNLFLKVRKTTNELVSCSSNRIDFVDHSSGEIQFEGSPKGCQTKTISPMPTNRVDCNELFPSNGSNQILMSASCFSSGGTVIVNSFRAGRFLCTLPNPSESLKRHNARNTTGATATCCEK